jgi:hypothetical protein
MGILTNPRHELFAQELAKGRSATEAYMLAGYKPCRQNAARLMTNDDIRGCNGSGDSDGSVHLSLPCVRCGPESDKRPFLGLQTRKERECLV